MRSQVMRAPRVFSRVGGAALLAAVALAPGVSLAAAAPAKTLDQLLQQTLNARAQELQENKAREQKFLAARNQQAQLLADAKRELAAQQARSEQLSAQYDANEKKLTTLQADLEAKLGALGELFGVTRQVANEVSTALQHSMISAQFQKRDEFVAELGNAKKLPSIDELERFWFEMQREMTENGRVARFKAKVVQPDGTARDTEVARVGAFTAVADGEYLTYQPGSESLQVLPRQPESPYPGLADDLQDARQDYVTAMVDPTSGVLLGLMAERPTWWERIKAGREIGFVIITVGTIGALLFLYQLFFLMGVGSRVKRQLANPRSPSTDNPLGRVLATFHGDPKRAEEDAEVVELRLSEAVLREVPRLERFQSFLRLAVAAGPLLGLIGTVAGMIITFQVITESGGGDPKLMAAGIGQAMIATFLGLGIAIPLLFANAWLTSRSHQIVQILDEQSTGLLAEALEEKRRA